MDNVKNWNSLKDFFKEVNSTVEYVVLRNYEEFIQGEFNVEHPDIDILCSSSSMFLGKIQTSSRNTNKLDKVHRCISVNNKVIALDIREVGDGYYDKKWEEEMLNNRRLVNDFCYILNDVDYFYSLLYHALLQKKTLSADYENKLTRMAAALHINLKKPITCHELLLFMKIKGYKVTYPEDLGVITNYLGVEKSILKVNPKREIKKIVRAIKNLIKKIIFK